MRFEEAYSGWQADRFGIGTAPRVIDQVRTAIKSWEKYANEAGVSGAQMQHVEALLLPLG